MYEQIQLLLSDGNLEDALQLASQSGNEDVILLMGRFNSTKRQYNTSMIPLEEWTRTRAQISSALIDIAKKLDKKAGTTVLPAKPATGGPAPSGSDQPSVFISYNHGDSEMVLRIKEFLESRSIPVTIDIENLAAGRSIVDFIRESMRNNNVILSVVSQNSLSSGWVGKESIASMFTEWLTNQRFIPVSLDHSFLSDDFYLEVLEKLSNDIEDKKVKAQKAQSLGGKVGPIQESIDRLSDLRHNLGDILERLKGRNVIDLTGDKFEPGMNKVLQAIV